MRDVGQRSLADARALVRGLRALSEARAPDTALPVVLDRLGLGDAYARLDTPLGPLYVAYSGAGILAVMRAEDDAAFERAFRARFGRPVRRGARPPAALVRACGRPGDRAARRSLRFDLRGLS